MFTNGGGNVKYLITGGAGFIGSHLTDALLDAGHKVVILDDLSTGRHDNLRAHADDTRVDIRSDSVAHGSQDQNETARQLNKKGDENDNAPAVLVRRGPVKLPARAIAKVSPPLSSSPIMTFKPRPMQADV